tara:strand:- start:142 stop:531 length:390 start_codon:yes stop_codon:yes gene_type:complete
MMAQIIRSILLLIIISCSVGGIYYFFDPTLLSFIKATTLAVCVQIIFFFVYNNILRYIARLNLEKESLQLAQLAEKNKIFIDCQGCKKTNSINIDLSQDNSFVCEKCGTENNINIEYTTTVPTKPIYDK